MPETKINLPRNIMSKISKGEAKMKPKWHYALGSAAMISGLVGITMVLLFLVSLISFFLRTHGPMGGVMRYERLISSFPWWALIVAIIGITIGIYILKKYDFSYKKNFLLIIFSFILVIIITGLLIDFLGLGNIWFKRGPINKIYQHYNGRSQP